MVKIYLNVENFLSSLLLTEFEGVYFVMFFYIENLLINMKFEWQGYTEVILIKMKLYYFEVFNKI